MSELEILNYYPNYRIEQKMTQKNLYYDTLWHQNDIYTYPMLKNNENISAK